MYLYEKFNSFIISFTILIFVCKQSRFDFLLDFVSEYSCKLSLGISKKLIFHFFKGIILGTISTFRYVGF